VTSIRCSPHACFVLHHAVNMSYSTICCAMLFCSCCTISCCTVSLYTILWHCLCTFICCAVLSSNAQCAKATHDTAPLSSRSHMRSCSIWPHCSCNTNWWLCCSCNKNCVAACLQEEFAGCCSQACLEAPRLLRPPKQAGYYGNWTTYRYQLYAASVTLSG